ncbi:HlyD family secretion protein [Nostoc sp.]
MRHFAIAAFILMSGVAVAQTPVLRGNDTAVETFTGTKKRGQGDNESDRTLRISLTADDPSFLKVKEGQQIKQGDMLIDNTLERERLDRQRKSVTLQIDNLKSKILPKPFEPKTPPPLAALPPANFLEEESAIAQAKLKLQQAQSVLESRYQLLQTDNPEARAESEKAEAGLRLATEKVREQEELIRSMQDMKLEPPVLRHEEAKLKQFTSEMEQTQSALDQTRAKLGASAINQQQELQGLEIAVQLAQSDLQMAQSRLETARNNRKLLEYKASLDATQRIEQQNQSNLAYTRQLQDYAQQQRDRDYQLAQLQISLAGIDDKLSQIPVVRSPRPGYIRRVKPWVGNNGRYTTTVTISASAGSSIDEGDSDRSNSTSP